MKQPFNCWNPQRKDGGNQQQNFYMRIKHTYLQNTKVGEFLLLDSKKSGRREVQCTCGNIRLKTNAELFKVESGILEPKCNICMMKERREDPIFMYKEIFAQYKRHAREDNREFSLTESEFLNIVNKPCTYCGAKPSNLLSKKKVTDTITKQRKRVVSSEQVYYSGIDRVDNSVGYIFSNCVPCCKMCNKAKHYHTADEFISWISQAYN